MHTDLSTLKMSLSGTVNMGCELIPHLNPVGDQSTNCTVLLLCKDSKEGKKRMKREGWEEGVCVSEDDFFFLVVRVVLASSHLHELDGAFVDVLGNNVSAVQQAAGHELAVPWVALGYLVARLEGGKSDLLH